MVTTDFLLLLSSTAFGGSCASATRMDSSPSSMVAGFRTEAISILFEVQIFDVDLVICGVVGGVNTAEVWLEGVEALMVNEFDGECKELRSVSFFQFFLCCR